MAEKLYTLTEVSKATGISMPTLQRYKKLYQDRIPSEGSGRTQRYPKAALSVFKELKKENISRRGRPRKNPDAPAKSKAPARKKGKSAKAKSSAKSQEGLLTLTEIGKITGISYPTLLRYVSMHLSKIPHKGTGRARRYLPEAVEVFKSLREESRRGRAPKKKAGSAKKAAGGRKSASSSDGALTGRIKALEKTIQSLQKQVAKVEKLVNKPLRVTIKR